MTQRNAFSLNLNFLKSQAKRRLILLKNNDAIQWQKLRHFYPNHSLDVCSVKLADVQLMIAREHGLSSWAKLKQHIETQEKEKQAIVNATYAPDEQLSCLHVRCGHDIESTLSDAGFVGDFLPWIDPFCVGPLFLDAAKQSQLRAKFVYDHYLNEIEGNTTTPAEILEQERDNWAQLTSDQYKQIVFWVEHDNYDQLMMIYLLAHLKDSELGKVEIIEVNSFPGSERYIGLGQLPPESIRSCWKKRKKVSSSQVKLAKQIWNALCQPDPLAVVSLLSGNTQARFPFIHPVLIRHLQQLPSVSHGLSMTCYLTLEVLKDNPEITVSDLFTRYQSKEPLPFLGDLMFWAMLKPLVQCEVPLLTVNYSQSSFLQHKLKLTEQGNQCLQGKYVHRPNEEFVGGIKLAKDSGWAWDHKQLATMIKYRNGS
ncbi:DUF1835 domain-containing protein [Vibrio sonorensis]|uniref:DUF1835 domain-containing protein n=1 Tax=Vibrio sonorensis TaxID=1004316 RepID=UPI0008DB2AB2|nr:DUF1835 domain-containing protein [Vibrio sonorensis]